MSDPLLPPDLPEDLATRPMTRWLRLAFACGLLPLLAGGLLYLGWRRTEAVGYEIAGVLALLFGTVLFLSGWTALLVHILSNPAATSKERRRLWGASLVVGLLLALQVPLAIVFIADVKASRDRYEVVVENASGVDLESLWIDTPQGRHRIAPFRDGSTFRQHLEPAPRGEIRYRFVLDGEPYEGLLDGSPHPGDTRTLRIAPGPTALLPP